MLFCSSRYPPETTFGHPLRSLDHLLDELVHQMLPVSPVTTTSLVEPVSLGNESSSRRVELEGPQESVHLLEVGTDRKDLVDDILGTMNSEMAELFRDESIVG